MLDIFKMDNFFAKHWYVGILSSITPTLHWLLGGLDTVLGLLGGFIAIFIGILTSIQKMQQLGWIKKNEQSDSK